jgi:hypothetical protein
MRRACFLLQIAALALPCVQKAMAVNLVPASLVASPAKMTLNSAGATAQLQVTATYTNGTSQNVTSNSSFATNHLSVVKVSQSGLITAVGNGTATLIASYAGMGAYVTVTVNVSGVTYNLSGSAGIGSAQLTLTGPSSATVTASSNGAYSFSGLVPGNYTITPSLSGYTFSPGSESVSITNTNVAGVNFNASAATHSVDPSWGAATIQNPAAGETIIGYDVYRSSVSGGPYTQLNGSPVSGLAYTDNAVAAGQTWYYVCSAVDNMGHVSSYSNQTSVIVP